MKKRLKPLRLIKLQLEIQRLSGRLATMEKISRDLNIEVQAVPEHRSENVLEMFKVLCKTLDAAISDCDIRACRRVAKANASSSNPRNILVTLTSSRLRDTVLSAAHRFNKDNPENMLNSTHLGLKDAATPIYIYENISLLRLNSFMPPLETLKKRITSSMSGCEMDKFTYERTKMQVTFI